MAGIGFVLRRLTQQDDYLGLIAGYGYSALVATGPWLFTILALGGSLLVGSYYSSFQEQSIFRIIVIYNFAFSLIFSGPLVMMVTRFLSDRIYSRNVEDVPGMAVGSLGLLFASQFIIAGLFYLYYVELELIVRILAVINYLLISGIWLLSVFLSALKNFNPIIRIFGVGMFFGFMFNLLFSQAFGAAGMLFGFNIGIMIILFALLAHVFSEYPYPLTPKFGFLSYFRTYWELALGGMVYNLGAWSDKLVMWFSPHREFTVSNLISYPDYDSAMFLAFLTIIPSLALFLVGVETEFYEHYLKFYRDIQNHASYERIQSNQRAIIKSIIGRGRNFIVLQGGISLLAILLAPKIFTLLGINYLQIGIFRLGVLGSFYNVLFMFVVIMLFYFDLRRHAFAMQCLFLVTNVGFSIISMAMGFPYYGYGYFLACLVSFTVATALLFHLLRKLPYLTFIYNNASVLAGKR